MNQHTWSDIIVRGIATGAGKYTIESLICAETLLTEAKKQGSYQQLI